MNRLSSGRTLLRMGLVSLGLLLVTAGAHHPSVRAEETAAPEAMSYGDGVRTKLGRGIANVFTAPLELIRTPELVGRETGSLAAQLTTGIVQGVWQTIVREVAGIYEVLTFYAEVPKGFRPLVKPEYVWKDGNWAE